MEGKSDAGGMEGEADNLFQIRRMERRMNEGHGKEGREGIKGNAPNKLRR